jgi:putative CocE/NonD family hydrolase
MKSLLFTIVFLTSSFGVCQTPFVAPVEKPSFREVRESSLYVPMRDGVRIAIDVLLPKELRADQTVPTIFKFSSFGRAAADGGVSEEDRFWVQHGFARVLMDERGTGASFGTSCYGPAMIPDLYDIVDWVVKQPWSNGRVGAIGISVEGNAAELLAATHHPAVRAVAPWFSDWNYYTDLVRPGGLFNEWILKNFEEFTLRQDSGASAKVVDGDIGGVVMRQAIAEHRNNLNIYSSERDAPFLDDRVGDTGKDLLELSVAGAASLLSESRVPMLIFSSWYDAGTAQGTIQRFQTIPNPQQVFVGAWSHGGNYNADPFSIDGPVEPDHQQRRLEALAFFDRYLKGESSQGGLERRFHYYVVGANQWRSTDVWPPRGLQKATYHLNPKGTLDLSSAGGKRKIRLQPTSTGKDNRWRTQLGGGTIDYNAVLPEMRRLDSFVTAPLRTNIELTGQPILRLRIACSQENDPSIIAYLLAIDPYGRASYLTEGHLRILQRKLNGAQQTLHSYLRVDALPLAKWQEIEADMTLLPISVLIKKDTRLQVVLSSGDNATFASVGGFKAVISSASTLELPIYDSGLSFTTGEK